MADQVVYRRWIGGHQMREFENDLEEFEFERLKSVDPEDLTVDISSIYNYLGAYVVETHVYLIFLDPDGNQERQWESIYSFKMLRRKTSPVVHWEAVSWPEIEANARDRWETDRKTGVLWDFYRPDSDD